MSVSVAAVSALILGVLYVRMIKRETPEPIGYLQALLPIALGVATMYLAVYLAIVCFGYLVSQGYIDPTKPTVLQGLLTAFVMAGFPEELFKFLAILVSVVIFRSRIKNVYEYILLGAAVAIGFTLAEEFYYADGANNVTLATRLLTVAGHMVFNIIMGEFLGRARYNKLTGRGLPALNCILAFLVPVAIHTLYDACTSSIGTLLASSPDSVDLIVVIGLSAYLGMIVLQIVVLTRFKKKAAAFCAMSLLPEAAADAANP